MTTLYFVRHAEPIHSWEDDRTRPLTPEGQRDSGKVTEFFKNIPVDVFMSSPYKRCIDTITGSAAYFSGDIIKDERFREREKRSSANTLELYRKRWADFSFCDQDGETLGSVQKRNMEALIDVLDKYQDKTIVIGTHGTALSTILNCYDPTYSCDSFLRMINFMPYIIRLDFEGTRLIKKEERLIIEKKSSDKPQRR